MTLINLGRSASVGMVAAFVQNFVPLYWLEMNGQVVAVADYPELSLVVPASWIAAGNITLPNMAGRTAIGKGTIGARTFNLGDEGGETDHTLTVGEIPAHDHTFTDYTDTNTVTVGIGVNVLDADSIGSDATGPTGGGGSHENMPPFIALTYAIFAGR